MMRALFVLAVGITVTLASVATSEDDITLSKLMVGKWRSPRHDYLYAADGTWRMLPPATTHGGWRIENHQLIVWWTAPQVRDKPPAQYDIQYIRRDEVLYGGVYHMTRLPD